MASRNDLSAIESTNKLYYCGDDDEPHYHQSKRPSLTGLPFEVIAKILLLLDIYSIVQCQRVSKELRCIALSSYVLKPLCRREGFLPREADLEHLTDLQHFSELEMLKVHQKSGRKEKEYENYSSFLSSSYLLRKVKQNLNLAFRGGSQWSPIERAPRYVAIDHHHSYLMVTTKYGRVVAFYDLSTGRYLCALPVPYLHQDAALDFSCGWMAHVESIASARDSRVLRLYKIEQHRSRPRAPYLARFPLLEEQGQIKAKHTIDACCFHYPLLASASITGEVIFYYCHTREIEEEITLTPFCPTTEEIIQLQFDDDFVWVISRFDDPDQVGCVTTSIQAYRRKTGKRVWEVRINDFLCRQEIYSITHQATESTKATGRVECNLRREAAPSEHLPMPESWLSVHFDPKTKSLCLLADFSFFVIPKYKNFLAPNGHRRIITLRKPDVRMFQFEYHHLAVSDGTAAVPTDDKIMLVDLASLVAINGSSQGNTSEELAPMSSVRYYMPPILQGRGVRFDQGIALTATHLAIAGEHDAWEADEGDHGTSSEGRARGTGHDVGGKHGILSIDFGTMRCQMVDDSRQYQSEEKTGSEETRKRKRITDWVEASARQPHD
ncbi:unnamed protein product [Sympodiomycopsis kandeliae]